jgi:putative membrane protein
LPAPSVSPADWSLDPSILAGIGVACALYVLAMRRGWLRHDDDTSAWSLSPATRSLCFFAGVLICFVALCSPIDAISDQYLLSVHMLQHMLLMMVAPPLVVLGLAGAPPPPARFLPRLRRVWTGVTRPLPAFFLFNLDLLVWHWPAFYDATLYNEALHAFEHLTFIAVGLVLWWPVVDPIRGEGTTPVAPLHKIALLALSGVPSTVLGLLFALASQPFYSFYVKAPRLWGLSALTDQQIAGVVMLVSGVVVGFLGITAVFLRMLRSPEDDERALEEELRLEAERPFPAAVRPDAG